eukprot:1146997-Pelagomonas_calceolata.AAC.1
MPAAWRLSELAACEHVCLPASIAAAFLDNASYSISCIADALMDGIWHERLYYECNGFVANAPMDGHLASTGNQCSS